jgi:hypothetical protein
LFQKQYDQFVPNIYTHIARELQPEVSGLLLAHAPMRYKNPRDVYRADIKDLADVVAHLFAPLDLRQLQQ